MNNEALAKFQKAADDEYAKRIDDKRVVTWNEDDVHECYVAAALDDDVDDEGLWAVGRQAGYSISQWIMDDLNEAVQPAGVMILEPMTARAMTEEECANREPDCTSGIYISAKYVILDTSLREEDEFKIEALNALGSGRNSAKGDIQ